MALYKEITMDNGVKISYFRISKINSVVNGNTEFFVQSYVDKDSRDREKNNEVYKTTISEDCYIVTYDENKNIKDFYDYLKTLECFEGATDI